MWPCMTFSWYTRHKTLQKGKILREQFDDVVLVLTKMAAGGEGHRNP